MKENLVLLAKLLATDDAFNLAFSSAKTDEEKFELSKTKINDLTRDDFSEFLEKLREAEKSSLSDLSMDELQMVSGGAGGWATKLAAAAMFVTTLGGAGLSSHDTEAISVTEAFDMANVKTLCDEPIPPPVSSPHVLDMKAFKKFLSYLTQLNKNPTDHFNVSTFHDKLEQDCISANLYYKLRMVLQKEWYDPRNKAQQAKTPVAITNQQILRKIDEALREFGFRRDHYSKLQYLSPDDVYQKRLEFLKKCLTSHDNVSLLEWDQWISNAHFSKDTHKKLLHFHPSWNAPFSSWTTQSSSLQNMRRQLQNFFMGAVDSSSQYQVTIDRIDKAFIEEANFIYDKAQQAEISWSENRPAPETIGLPANYYDLNPDDNVFTINVQSPDDPRQTIPMEVPKWTLDHIFFGDFGRMGNFYAGGHSSHILKRLAIHGGHYLSALMHTKQKLNEQILELKKSIQDMVKPDQMPSDKPVDTASPESTSFYDDFPSLVPSVAPTSNIASEAKDAHRRLLDEKEAQLTQMQQSLQRLEKKISNLKIIDIYGFEPDSLVEKKADTTPIFNYEDFPELESKLPSLPQSFVKVSLIQSQIYAENLLFSDDTKWQQIQAAIETAFSVKNIRENYISNDKCSRLIPLGKFDDKFNCYIKVAYIKKKDAHNRTFYELRSCMPILKLNCIPANLAN